MSKRLSQLSPLRQAPLLLVLVTFLALGIVYSIAVPILEKPDESFHYFFVQHLLDEQSLPVMGSSGENRWAQEGSQPPLYYVLAALALSWTEPSDADDLLWLNPQRNLGDPENPGNKNFIVHTERESWPYSGAVLAVHVARWLSLLFGLGTVALTFLIVSQAFPERPLLALSAAAINAFIPQFLFISSSVSNDSLITFLSALVFFQLVKLLNRPGPSPMASYVPLGITLGLAALTKLSGLALLGLSGLVLAWLAVRQRSWRPLLVGGLILLGLTAAIAGWWYIRNLRLYGDLTGLNLHLEEMGGRRDLSSLTIESVWAELSGLRASFWGLFGWFSILMPAWVYQLLDLVALVGAAGLIGCYRRKSSCSRVARRTVTLALLWLAAVTISLLRWTTMVQGSQGRLLFPAIPGIALALAIGWSNLLPKRWMIDRWRDLLATAVAAGLLLLSAAVPGWVIAPAYARPPLLETDDLPAGLSMDITFGTSIRLYGCQTDLTHLRPGETVAITCYWEALAPTSEDYFIYHHLLGRGLEPIGKEHGYPGSGTFPTSLWPTGQVIAATEWVRIDQDATAPVLGRVAVGIFDPDTGKDLIPTAPQGDPLELVIVEQVKIEAPRDGTIPIPHPIHYSIGDLATLVGYEVEQGETLAVTLYWEATAGAPEDYTVFVHLLDEGGTMLGQGDSPPINNDYPTSFWEPGEIIVDEHLVEADEILPPGKYRLVVGFYRPADGVRLPVWDAAGVPQAGDRVILPAELEYPQQ